MNAFLTIPESNITKINNEELIKKYEKVFNDKLIYSMPINEI